MAVGLGAVVGELVDPGEGDLVGSVPAELVGAGSVPGVTDVPSVPVAGLDGAASDSGAKFGSSSAGAGSASRPIGTQAVAASSTTTARRGRRTGPRETDGMRGR